jgi:AGCS family alanine or glycine:cation symporter
VQLLLQQISNWIWGPVLVGLLIGVGILLTLLLKGIQFRYLIKAFRLVFKRRSPGGEGDVSPFQALTTALAGTIGTGNIAGVATAVSIGGLGAIFWMWVSGFVGMVLAYSEALLGVRFRVVNRYGRMAGGPMYYIEQGLGWKWLAILFALFGILASLGIGNTVQAHSIADVLSTTLHVPPLVTGIVLAGFVALVILGGIRTIGRITSILVPAMAIFYVVGGLVVIGLHWDQLPSAFAQIVNYAFSGQAMVGGFLGSSAMVALRMGIARGLFSNEAGLGSAAIAAAAAKTEEAGRQALILMTGPFIDTIVVCTITGLVLAVTGVLGTVDHYGFLITGAPLTAYAFDIAFPWGGTTVAIGLVLFAYSTILGWAYYGEKCLEYLIGERSFMVYRICFVCIVVIGALVPLKAVWNFADIANGLMAIPNLIALIGLSGIIVYETRLYLKTHRSLA